VKLNLGCGRMLLPGYLNVDMSDDVGADKVGDVRSIDWLLPGGLRVEEIVAYDVIEHFDSKEVVGVLDNWYSHMEPLAQIKVRTNDLDRLVALYAATRAGIVEVMPAERIIWHLMCEHQTPGMGHKWCYTRATLERLLRGAGFTNIMFTPDHMLSAGKAPLAGWPDHTNMLATGTKPTAAVAIMGAQA
jgi:predicted SAM-dependent methyltransferase